MYVYHDNAPGTSSYAGSYLCDLTLQKIPTKHKPRETKNRL